MHTEQEAHKKWCPEGRIQSPNGFFAVNQNTGEEPCALCIASECMHWRWVEKWETTPQLDKNGRPVSVTRTHLDPTHGYCGLSGRPE